MDGGGCRLLPFDEGGRSSGSVKGSDGGEGADSVEGEGGESHRGEGRRGRRRGGGGEGEATRSERGEHVNVDYHSFSSHPTLIVRDDGVKRGDERMTGDKKRAMKGG